MGQYNLFYSKFILDRRTFWRSTANMLNIACIKTYIHADQNVLLNKIYNIFTYLKESGNFCFGMINVYMLKIYIFEQKWHLSLVTGLLFWRIEGFLLSLQYNWCYDVMIIMHVILALIWCNKCQNWLNGAYSNQIASFFFL